MVGLLKGGWTGRILWIDLTKGTYTYWSYDPSMALEYLGGRGFAIKILWDCLKPGIDPFHQDNLLIFATGPLTGLPFPSTGKLIVASKSPLTGGYGDGNIGTKASVMMKKAGLDAIVIQGKAGKPVYICVDDDRVSIEDARDYWGLNAKETYRELAKLYGASAGILTIGEAGENLIKIAVVMSEEDRAGGRPGMGAVMGSKNLKALVVIGRREVPIFDEKKAREVGTEAYKFIKSSPQYPFWMEQGTMATYAWAQENSVLPTYNFREGIFELASEVDGDTMAKRYKIFQKGCPLCNMACGNVAEAKVDFKGTRAEMDYENVAMLSSNIGIGKMDHVIKLIRICDDLGIDTISLGSFIGFTIDAFEKGLISRDDLDGIKPCWGDVYSAIEIINLMLKGKGFGGILREGLVYASHKLGGDAAKFAMHVKGLPISAYDCHVAPAMALAYGTSPIGAHHKDAWVIAWEAKYGFEKVDRVKVEKVVELQDIRGGWFEEFTVCRFPWVEVSLSLDYYPKFLEAATGLKWSFNELNLIANRIYTLIRAFWIREYGYWNRSLDVPPPRWFVEPLTKGPRKGAHLSYEAYNQMLDAYYELRGWDSNGVPRRSTLINLNLSYVIPALEERGIKLSD